MTEFALRLTGVSKRFGAVQALEDLTIEVGFGQVVGFLGLNGAGKTTAVRIIAGLLRPDQGTVEVLGNPPPGPRSSPPGFMLEQPAFYPWLSGAKNLLIALETSGRHDRSRIDECLDLVHLTPVRDRPVRGYSQGMRQRLALAAACLTNPRLLVMDEPTNGLDPEGVRDFRRMIGNLRASGVAVFLSSHLLGEVEKTCDHIVIVRSGRAVRAGSVRDLLNASGSVVITVEAEDVALASAVVDQVGTSWGREPHTIIVPVDRSNAVIESLISAGVSIAGVNRTQDLEGLFFSTMAEE